MAGNKEAKLTIRSSLVVDSYMASDAGKDRLLNVMKAHAYSFRNVLEVN